MKRLLSVLVCAACFFLFHKTNQTAGKISLDSPETLTQATTGVFLLAQGKALAQTPADKGLYLEISEIFKEHCIVCHAGSKPPRGLRLDTYAGVMAGGEKESVIIPGKPGESELVLRIKGISKPRMPFNGPPWLSKAQIEVIERWIKAGAPG